MTITTEQLTELGDYIDALETTDGALIRILHHAQNLYGFLPPEVQLYVARRLGLPAAEVFGVVSFYSYFTMKPPGRHTVAVCMGTACYVRGAEQILHALADELGVAAGETTGDGMFTLKDVRCVGTCGLAPVVIVGEKVFGRVKLEDMPELLKEFV